ncbi:MAG TPA: hypothetical protein VFR29_00590 [Steroidobacteraceae bacterium]|nr:hypothetical protein [Steroidobacteraceae bacterium]
MQGEVRNAKLLAVSDVREFFREALHLALGHQHLKVRDHTEQYVVNLLAMFARSEALFDAGPDGHARLKPLALMLAEAIEAPDDRHRYRTLQRLGDVALFIAGFLAGGFARRTVDVDYHIAMGGRAYGALAQAPHHGPQRALAEVFAELEDKFQPLVDVLQEIGDGAQPDSPRDLLRLYELWHRTGSRRAHRLLMQHGVQPVAGCGRPH